MLAAALFAFAVSVQAQTVQLRSTINASQAVPASTSTATGSAVMIYDIGTNTFDLAVTLNNLAATIVAARIEEGAAGAAGTTQVTLGSDAAFVRSGNTATATFRSIPFPAAKIVTLVRNGMFLNFTTAGFTGGEVRGQLVSQPKRLYANIDVAQERATFPANANLANAAGFGAAVMTYDPASNKLNMRVSLFNYPNTLSASHYHQENIGVSGPVVTNLGAGTVANYTISGTQINGTFLDLTAGATSDPIKLMTGGQYLNFHSNINAQGEVRGQVFSSEESPSSRAINLSTRGFVSATEALIGGIVISGPEPVRILFTARGPSLSAFGVTNALANPTLAIHNAAGVRIAGNDDVGAVAAGSEMASIYGVPTTAAESAIVLVLPPGSYTAVVTSSTAGGTGVALLEAFDVRNNATINAGATGTVAGLDTDRSALEEFMADMLLSEKNPMLVAQAISAKALELCGLPVEPGAKVAPVPAVAVAKP